MNLTDPVADMLARIRNAIRARHQKVDVPASKLKLEIARILKEEGYISNFKPTEDEGHKVVRIYLKYDNNNDAAISNVERVSRPGCRVYVRRTEIPRVLGGMGINILTTPRGVMTGRQARRNAIGAWDSRSALSGLHHDVAPWLKERGVALLGSDGVSDYRAHPFTVTMHPMHVLTLVAMGMQLLDNQNLEDLAAACAARSRWEFMLVIAPLKLIGGTASMVNPVAIF